MISEEKRKKLSEAQKRRWANMNDEERENILKRLHSKEARENISKSCKGRSTWNKGMKGVFHHSEETKRKISETEKGRIPWNKGKKLSKETIYKMSISRQKFYRENPTDIEVKVAEQLEKYKIKYIYQKPICKGHFIIDFYLPEYQLVIECNGDYWHNRQERKFRDKEFESYVKSKGKDILWLWEHEINDDWFDISDYLEI